MQEILLSILTTWGYRRHKKKEVKSLTSTELGTEHRLLWQTPAQASLELKRTEYIRKKL